MQAAALPVGYATISRPSKNLTRSLNEASPTSFREPPQASAISPVTKSCCSLEVSTWGFVPGNAERFGALSGNPSSPHVKLEVQTTPRTIHISSGCPDRVEGLFPPCCSPKSRPRSRKAVRRGNRRPGIAPPQPFVLSLSRLPFSLLSTSGTKSTRDFRQRRLFREYLPRGSSDLT